MLKNELTTKIGTKQKLMLQNLSRWRRAIPRINLQTPDIFQVRGIVIKSSSWKERLVKVKLLKNTKFGLKDQVLHVRSGTMRNDLYPKKQAVYVLDEEDSLLTWSRRRNNPKVIAQREARKTKVVPEKHYDWDDRKHLTIEESFDSFKDRFTSITASVDANKTTGFLARPLTAWDITKRLMVLAKGGREEIPRYKIQFDGTGNEISKFGDYFVDIIAGSERKTVPLLVKRKMEMKTKSPPSTKKAKPIKV